MEIPLTGLPAAGPSSFLSSSSLLAKSEFLFLLIERDEDNYKALSKEIEALGTLPACLAPAESVWMRREPANQLRNMSTSWTCPASAGTRRSAASRRSSAVIKRVLSRTAKAT